MVLLLDVIWDRLGRTTGSSLLRIDKVDTDLEIYETYDHAVMEWDQRRWLVILHLLEAFHEYVSSV